MLTKINGYNTLKLALRKDHNETRPDEITQLRSLDYQYAC